MKKRKKKLKGLEDAKNWNWDAMNRNMEKFLGIPQRPKKKRIFRKESAYISR